MNWATTTFTRAVLNIPELAAERSDSLDPDQIGHLAGPHQPLDAGRLRTAEAVPGNTRKESKIMTTPFTHLLAAVASLATVYSVVAASGNAWAADTSEVAPASAELVQWHSELSGTSDSRFKPEWKGTLTAFDPQDLTAYLVMHGAVGLRDVAEDGFDHSIDSFDEGGRKSARDPARIHVGSPSGEIAR